jgi:formate-dependent nitrite reductase membrane component NrfD
MKEKQYWGWPVAGYLFLGGLGGGMTIVSTAADLLWGQGRLFAFGSLAASILIGVGSGLLIFELGRPFRFWRVFSTQKAVMTVGAWLLGLLIVTGVAYFSFWLTFLPWSGQVFLRQILSLINLFLGIGVVTYTGVLLGSMKARPFWNSPVLPVLFAVSGLSTGMAAQSLLAGFWPWQGDLEAISQVHGFLHHLDAGLLSFEILILMVYVGMMRFSAGEEAGGAAARWLAGSYAPSFWGGLAGLGLLLPLVLYFLGGQAVVIAPVCVITGGVFLRFLVVFSDDRKLLPGEEKYRSRLPHGDEAFLKAWKTK